MAKPPKKRTKKINRTAIIHKEVTSVVNHCYQRIAFLGDCFAEPHVAGIQQMFTHLKGAMLDVGITSLVEHLNRPMNWTLGVCCYFINREEENSYTITNSEAIFPEDSLMVEVSKNLGKAIIECINLVMECDKTLLEKDLVYYNFVLTPEYHEKTTHPRLDGLGDITINSDILKTLEPFCDELPGNETNEETLFKALDRGVFFPQLKDRQFWPISIEYYC